MASKFERRLGEQAALLRDTFDSVLRLWSFGGDGEALACFGAAAGIEHGRILRGLRIQAETAVALFELAERPSQRVTQVIDGQAYQLFVEARHGYCGPSEWQAGFFASCACRDAASFARLVAVTDQTLFYSRPTAQRDEYQYAMVGALRALARRDNDVSDRLSRAISLVQLERVTVSPEDVRERHAREIELALHLHDGNAARFNDALEAALVAHRAYWSKDEERREDPSGYLALAPLGLASIAHDRGMPIEVESNYIPTWVVRGES